MPDVGKLISGFRVFKTTTFPQQQEIVGHLLRQGQKPTTMVISCVDISIAPAEIFSCHLGELYIVTNVGGLVPEYKADGVHGILAGIEFAVKELMVENIIVLGHANCNSIKMMMSDRFASDGLSESMRTWLSIAQKARDAVKNELSDKTADEQQVACEHESIVVSLKNLMGYPYIAKRVEEGNLAIFGWHFDVETGDIMSLNYDNGFFEPIS